MDADYIASMENEDVRLEPVEADYEERGGPYRERNLSDSFEPLEVSHT